MKLVICAGPATTGKTAVLRHVIRKLQDSGQRVAFLKIDVQYAEERKLATVVSHLDDVLSNLRDKIRFGERITSVELEGLA